MENKKHYIIKTTELMDEGMSAKPSSPCESYVYTTIDAVREELKLRTDIYRESDCEWEGKDKVTITVKDKYTVILEAVEVDVKVLAEKKAEYDDIVGRVIYHIVIEGKTRDEFYISEESLESFISGFEEKMKKNGFRHENWRDNKWEQMGRRGLYTNIYKYYDGEGVMVTTEISPLTCSDKAMNMVFGNPHEYCVLLYNMPHPVTFYFRNKWSRPPKYRIEGVKTDADDKSSGKLFIETSLHENENDAINFFNGVVPKFSENHPQTDTYYTSYGKIIFKECLVKDECGNTFTVSMADEKCSDRKEDESREAPKNEIISSFEKLPKERKDNHKYVLSVTEENLFHYGLNKKTEIISVGTADEIIRLFNENIGPFIEKPSIGNSISEWWTETIINPNNGRTKEFGLDHYRKVDVTGVWLISNGSGLEFQSLNEELYRQTLMIEEIAK